MFNPILLFNDFIFIFNDFIFTFNEINFIFNEFIYIQRFNFCHSTRLLLFNDLTGQQLHFTIQEIYFSIQRFYICIQGLGHSRLFG